MSPAAKTQKCDPKPANLATQLLDVVKLLHLPGDTTSVDDALMMMHEAGLTTAQLIALHSLREDGAHSVSQIAEKARLSRPATSHLVDRLVVMGLVVRVEDERDRRHKQVSLEAKGAALIDRLSHARRSRVAAGIEALSASTRSRLAEVLADIEEELVARTHARATSEDEKR
jgi:DNA-binding MarR family transcriptional regulator